MKLDIIIVDFAMVAAVFLPYFLFILFGRKEEDRLKKKFSEEVQKHHLHINEMDSWNHNIVGLDKEKAKIIFVQKRRGEIAVELIDLKQIRSCKVLQEEQTVKVDKHMENILQKISLELKLHNGVIQVVTLYDCEETYSQDYELKHAEKWSQIISSTIIFRPTLNSAA